MNRPPTFGARILAGRFSMLRADGSQIAPQLIAAMGFDRLLKAAVPWVLDEVSDWWDGVGPRAWPPGLAPTDRLSPQPHLWVEWLNSDPALGGRPTLCGASVDVQPAAAFRPIAEAMMGSAAKTLLDAAEQTVWINVFAEIPDNSGRILMLPPALWGLARDGRPIRTMASDKKYEYGVLSPVSWLNPETGDLEAPAWVELSVWRVYCALERDGRARAIDVPTPVAVRRDAPSWATYKSVVVEGAR